MKDPRRHSDEKHRDVIRQICNSRHLFPQLGLARGGYNNALEQGSSTRNDTLPVNLLLHVGMQLLTPQDDLSYAPLARGIDVD